MDDSARVREHVSAPDERVSPASPHVPVGTAASDVLRLQRQVGNRATARLLARDDVAMRPTVVTSTLGGVESSVTGLDQLRGVGVDPSAISMSFDEETIRRNSPQGDRALPFSGEDGWDAQAILTSLGQHDTNTQTDSDALRCVQSVALASRIVAGPQAVRSFLSSAILDGMLSTSLGTRQRTAINVLRHVSARIETRRATFGDLSWAQEALHDLFYTDVVGTPAQEILARVSPALDTTITSEARATWFDTPEAVMAEANRLADGEQLLLNTWRVAFNESFDQLEEQGIHVPAGRSQVVDVDGRRVRIRRLDATTKPAHTAIDPNRDRKSGHQLLIIRDSRLGGLKLYEPEVTTSGRHLEALTAEVLQRYFHDLPDIQIYEYVQVLGKLTPSRFGQVGWGGSS